MRANATGRIAVVLGGFFLLLAALFAALSILNGPAGFSSCSGTAGCGWVVPLFAGLVIGGALWVLAGQAPTYMPRDGDDRTDPEERCSECGGAVMAAWRLCPTCGTRLKD